MFIRRLGETREQPRCVTGYHCPQILEMSCGSFGVVGTDITDEAKESLPPGPGIGSNEKMVKIPRHVLIAAIAELAAPV